jgi:carbamoylphosphate synthase large subunit
VNLINGISDSNFTVSSLADGVYILEIKGENSRKIFVKE